VVSLPYHNPLMVANRIIQLDHMTMGRVMFGAGPGLLADRRNACWAWTSSLSAT
jgi:alkanesulfonate monooxygenase SsuD/methylene tetrahydromethanopterin reductase-like flavin-dependent oxidoreductase (luciferase family)